MPRNLILDKSFFNRNTLEVAKSLLGKILVRQIGKVRMSGRITEVEAYHGMDDLACHASKGKTERTKVMFDRPGMIYVYMIYGIYYCLNIVTMPPDFPAAVLIRSIEPIEGKKYIQKNRGEKTAEQNLTNGPGKLCQALAIDKKLNGKVLEEKSGLWVEDDGYLLNEKDISSCKRIGVSYAKHCADWEWNFRI
ncbi:MAG TPA: DNA-3-methyladenine glycosylase [bacterium]|nr:DNA-3-methyladenine glycosylase [bacterium]